MIVENNGYNLNAGTFFSERIIYVKNKESWKKLSNILLTLEENQDKSLEEQIEVLRELLLQEEYLPKQAN
jgi:hypothetical protein